MFQSLWRKCVRSDKRPARPRSVRRAADLFRRRPMLEALEDRTVLDASLSIPTNVPGPYGTDVMMPVTINQLDDGHGATGLSQVDLDIAYDKTAFTVDGTTGVTLGALLPSAQWGLSYGIVSSTTFPGDNELQITLKASQNLTTTAGGTLVNIKFHVNNPGAAPGNSPINLANNASTGNVTDVFGANGQQYVLNPAPTNASNDPNVDGSIDVGAPQQVIYALSAPTPATAGTAFNFTITAEFTNGSADPFYNGTAHFTSTDPKAVLPPDTTFTAGTSTLTLSATLKTAGTQKLTATDTADSSITGTSNAVTVNPAPASQVVITQQPSPTATAGVAFATQPVVKLEDAFGNVETGDSTDTITAASTGTAALQGNTTVTLKSGVATFSGLSYDKAETIKLSFTTTAGSFTATSNNVVVSPNVATHLAVVAPSPVTAGVAFNFTVTALDAFGNTATGYAGTVHFTTVDNVATLPPDYTFTTGGGGDDGAHTFSATLDVAGKQTISAIDTVTGTINGTSNLIEVDPGQLSHFSVSGQASPTAGVTGYTYLVIAQDQFGNVVPTYAGTVHLTSSDPLATLPPDYTFVPAADNGEHSFPVTFRTVGGATVTATDTMHSVFGTDQVSVNPATILISAPSTATEGTAFNYTVTVKDFFGNVATGYTGTLHFKTTDPLVSAGSGLPADYTFTSGTGNDNGVHTFSATLETAGNQTITATDTVTFSSTGTSAAIQVFAGVQFVKSDGTTQGYWQGAYGGDGFNVINGGAASYPKYATVTTAGATGYFWAASTPDPRALQKPANPADRVAAMLYSTTSFTVDVNLTDQKSHPVALYLLDFDGGNGRSERIDVADTLSGKVLDSQTASNFGAGEYLVWSIQGHVTFTITRLSGPNAVLSGLFFGPAGSPPSGTGSAAFVKSDTATQGFWQGAYGGDGSNVVGAGTPSYPAYVTVTPVGPATYVWAASTPELRGLQQPGDPSARIAAALYAANTFTINLSLTGGTHQVALYLLDFDGGGRSERVDVLDAVNGKVLDSQTASNFGSGEYLVWTLGGSVTLRFTGLSGPNAVLSGLFFGPAGSPPAGTGSATFVKSDGTTQGTWQNTYGNDGFNVIDGGATNYPAYASVTPVGNADIVFAASTSDVRALQKPAPATDRVAAAWYSASNFTVNMNLTGGAHQVALYLLDWDGGGRKEQIDVLDAVSGKVLDSETVSGFQGGEYLVWDVGGAVTFRITKQSGPNAVLSGLFFDPTV